MIMTADEPKETGNMRWLMHANEPRVSPRKISYSRGFIRLSLYLLETY